MNRDPLDIFPSRLKQCREMRGMTMIALGREAGKFLGRPKGSPMSASQIYDFEHGRRLPSANTLCALADALGVDVDYLLGRVVTYNFSGPLMAKLLDVTKTLDTASLNVLVSTANALKKHRRGE